MIFCKLNGWMFHHMMTKKRWIKVYEYKYLGLDMVAFAKQGSSDALAWE